MTISREHAQEFTETLAQHMGTSWRQIALAKDMGVPMALGLSVEEWVTQKLGGYVRMAAAERREAVKELKAEGLSNREAAEILGVDARTIRRDGGANAPATGSDTGESADDGGANAPPDPESAEPLDDDDDWLPPSNYRAQGTGENEWYTPAQYIELARTFLGAIDLDPASSEVAQRTVKATRYFTIEDDGLQQEWRGRVWLNPPYSQPSMGQFVRKMVESARQGVEAVMLTHNYTDTDWFQTAARAASAVCFTRGRIAFADPSGVRAAPTQGQAFFYFGPAKRVAEFARAFNSVGLTVRLA